MKLPCKHTAAHHLTPTWWEGQATPAWLPLPSAELGLPERIPGEALYYFTCFACIISTTGSNWDIQCQIFQQWPPGSLISSTFEWRCWHPDTDEIKFLPTGHYTHLWQGHLGVWLPTVSLQWLPKLRKPRSKSTKAEFKEADPFLWQSIHKPGSITPAVWGLTTRTINVQMEMERNKV